MKSCENSFQKNKKMNCSGTDYTVFFTDSLAAEADKKHRILIINNIKNQNPSVSVAKAGFENNR